MCLSTERGAILDRLLASGRSSRGTAAAYLALDRPTPEDTARFVRIYVGEKFLAPELPAESDSLYDLGQASYRRLQQLQTEGKLGDEWNTGCSGASSAMARKALFFMSLQRELHITLPPAEIEAAETVGDVIRLCLRFQSRAEA